MKGLKGLVLTTKTMKARWMWRKKVTFAHFSTLKNLIWYDLEVETFASRISYLRGDYFVLAYDPMSSLHPLILETDWPTSTLFQGLIASTSSLGWPPSLFVWLSSASATCSGPIPSSANVAKSVKARWRWTSTVTSMGRTAGGRTEEENMETGIECMFKIQMTIMVPNYLGQKHNR